MTYKVSRIWHSTGAVEPMLITASLRDARREVRSLERHHADIRESLRQVRRSTTPYQATVWLE